MTQPKELAEAPAQARRYLRRALKAGALQLRPDATLVQAAATALQLLQVEGRLQSCGHVDDDEQTGGLGFGFYPLAGPDAFQLRCPDCFHQPTVSDGCQVCSRRPAPQLRTLVYVHDNHGMVMVGQLCHHCRPGRV